MKSNVVEEMLGQKVWAVMGVSRDKSKFGYKVFKRLREQGYTVYAINPNMIEVDTQKCYAGLDELPEIPQVVCFVVPPSVTKRSIEDCKRLGVSRLWMQPGSADLETVRAAESAGMSVAYDVCVLLLA